ncbi:hypothetical protein RJ639_018176, partial [Escallonia herrerae]
MKGDGFLKYPRKRFPDTRNSLYNGNLTLQECHKVCLKTALVWLMQIQTPEKEGVTACFGL